MSKTSVHGVTDDELHRLTCAYISIRDTGQRREFLTLVEAWASEQWTAGDAALGRSNGGK